MPNTPTPPPTPTPTPTATLDVRGYLCPIPALKAEEAMATLKPGDTLEILGDDPTMLIDIPAWCDNKGHTLITCERRGPTIYCLPNPHLDPNPPPC